MFRLLKKSKISKARLGVVQTARGRIPTPFFMPDATRGAIKGLSINDLRALGLEAMVINTYHLLLRPGMDIIKKAGGAHKFMNFAGPLCSDSGGYQVYSLIHKSKFNALSSRTPVASGDRMRDLGLSSWRDSSPPSGVRNDRWELANHKKDASISDNGVIFRSPLDGSARELTPEKSIQIQFALGADIIVCLDDCPPHDLTLVEMEKSVARTIAWARRCRAEYERLVPVPILQKPMLNRPQGTSPRGQKAAATSAAGRPLIFAVIQGGTNLSLRKKCAEALLEIGFDGYGLGARPVDGNGKFLSKIVSGVADLIPENKPRFALGAGAPADIIKCVKAGWDIFDCVIPTREGRHGRLYIEADRRGWRRGLTRRPNDIRVNPRLVSRLSASININNSRFARDFSPINPNSCLPELRATSRAYLHHLFKIGEPQAGRLATLNNLEFYLDLMKALRVAIRRGLL